MFARLRGIIAEKKLDKVVLDVNGVGYDVNISLTTYNELPEDEKEAILYIHTHVREDAIRLMGFCSLEEKQLFLMLIQVSGIGPRVAFNILSGITPSEFVATLKQNNLARLTSIPGIGKRTAERLIVELKDKVVKLSIEAVEGEAEKSDRLTGKLRDLQSALTNMGYKPNQIEKVLKEVKADAEAGMALGALVRSCLQKLNKSK